MALVSCLAIRTRDLHERARTAALLSLVARLPSCSGSHTGRVPLRGTQFWFLRHFSIVILGGLYLFHAGQEPSFFYG